MASKFRTIHIFGFGVAQVIDKDLNLQCKVSEVQAQVDACVNNVWSKKPSDSNITTNEYHAINVFDDMFADWQPKIKGEKGYRTEYKDLDDSLFQALAQAIIDAQPIPTTPTP
jgi:hypothetical protein